MTTLRGHAVRGHAVVGSIKKSLVLQHDVRIIHDLLAFVLYMPNSECILTGLLEAGVMYSKDPFDCDTVTTKTSRSKENDRINKPDRYTLQCYLHVSPVQ